MVEIKKFAEQNYAEMLTLFEQLCKIPAPSLMEDKRAEFCKEWLSNIGFNEVYIDSAKNVVLPINCEGKDRISVAVAHTDTVFPDLEPMPYVDDGKNIHCPGSGDDTASLAVLLYVAKYIKENEINFPNGLLLVCNSAEEGLGNLKGTRQIFTDYCGRIARFISFDDEVGNIADRCVGSCRYNVTVKTKGGHSYSKFGNPNAIHILSEIITQIYGIEIPCDGVSKTTLNVGTISGGTSVNTIAQNAEMLCEYRSDNYKHLEIMKTEFLKIFEDAKKYSTEISFEVVGERPCAKDVDETQIDYLRETLSGIIKNITGKDVTYTSSSTDCNIPLSLGVPAICIGIHNGSGAHTREEWVEKESLKNGLEIGINTVLKIAD